MPGTPTLNDPPIANNEDGQIELSWIEPDEGSSPITSYQIQRWDGSDWEYVATNISAEDDEFDDTKAEKGRTYYYAIRAVSSAGIGAWTQHSFPNAMLNAEKPDKIEDLSATADGQTITLTWTAPAANGTPITGYELEFTDDLAVSADGEQTPVGNRTWAPIDRMGPDLATTYTHRMRIPGKTYFYRIRAINLCNDDDGGDVVCGGAGVDAEITDATKVWSSEESDTAAAMAPNMPDPVSATGGTTVVNLTWMLPGPDDDKGDVDEDDEVDGTGGAVITGAEVQRWNSSTGQWDPIKTVEVTLNDAGDAYTAGNGTDAYQDTGLDDGTPYTYRVRAVNSAGGGAWSAMFSATTADAAPDVPELTATVSGQDVVLTWTVPDDNGASIMHYEIQRFPSIAAGGTVQQEWGDDLGTAGRDGNADNDDVIIPAPAGVTTHTDMDLVPGQIYYYRIRAVNSESLAVGADGVEWSDEVRVTTAPKAPDRIADDPATLDDTDTDDVVENYEGLVLTPSANKITLSWTAPAHNGSPISEYQIQRWDSTDRMWDTIKDQLPASVTSYEDTGLAAGTRYFYRMRAVNAGGAGPWSTLTQAETPEDEQ